MTTMAPSARAVLEEACAAAGLTPADAEPVRIAENQIWRLPGRVIVRIVRPGQWAAAVREVRVARWLADHDLPAVRPLEVGQPVQAADHPVTFWQELPPHRHGTVMDVVRLLKQLHALPIPGFALGRLDPFVRIAERIDAATTLSEDDQQWLRRRLADLENQWAERPPGLPECVVHGDAWVGNVARTATGPAYLLDLERCTVGPPEWDLVSTAVKLTTTGTVTADEYAEFCAAYGTDVTHWDGYELLAGARELRMATYAAQHAAIHLEWEEQAQHRVDCLRGRSGPRPWRWKGIL
jgi:aminoglycoside phosphotransferase